MTPDEELQMRIRAAGIVRFLDGRLIGVEAGGKLNQQSDTV